MAAESSELFGTDVDVLTRSSVEWSQNCIHHKEILETEETFLCGVTTHTCSTCP